RGLEMIDCLRVPRLSGRELHQHERENNGNDEDSSNWQVHIYTVPFAEKRFLLHNCVRGGLNDKRHRLNGKPNAVHSVLRERLSWIRVANLAAITRATYQA